MTSILAQYPCWPNRHLIEPSERMLGLRVEHHPLNHSSSTNPSPASSTSTSPRSSEADSMAPPELAAARLLPPEHIPFAASITPAQLYALQELRNAGLYQQQMMLHQMAGPVHGMGAQGPLAYMPNFAALAASSMGGMMSQVGGVRNANSAAALEPLLELPEVSQRVKRKRVERLNVMGEERLDGEESDSESQYERFRAKQVKLSEVVPESDLSDITSLLSLPQKEAAQRLGISESMLCKRFKECTRRKWPFRLLRKIEKTISTLEAQQILEPLSLEDQDKLEELRKQRIECLAPVKIRITKSPSPVPSSSRAFLSMDSDSQSPTAEDDSDSDDSDTRETDFEMEAIEKLIHLSRATSPRSPPFFY